MSPSLLSPVPALSDPSSSSSTPPITQPATPSDQPICTPLHAIYCFDVLVAHFEKREPMDPPFGNVNAPYALFVTWNTTNHLRPNKKPALRGCIGKFSPLPLAKGLREYALISALEDERFSPIKSSELSSLSCSVSLLTPFTSIPDPLAWIPGTHGIHITFPHPLSPHRTLSATYLPEICPEQGWTKEETVKSAIQKAGWRGTVRVGDDVWKSLKVRVYGSVKAGVDYQGYKDWRERESRGLHEGEVEDGIGKAAGVKQGGDVVVREGDEVEVVG